VLTGMNRGGPWAAQGHRWGRGEGSQLLAPQDGAREGEGEGDDVRVAVL
jgi:hypothetical protein